MGGYREEGWDPANPGQSMPFVPLAALLFLLGDVFEGHRQQDDPASVPLLTPHAGGGINPSPLWVVHGRPPLSRACAAVHGCSKWAIVLLLPAGPFPDTDECSVPEVVRMSNVPHDPHVAVTSLRDGGPVEQGSVVVYQPSCLTTVWGAEYTTALDAIKSVCGCDVAWRPHAVYQPNVVLSPELTAFSAASREKSRRAPTPTWHGWNPAGTVGCRWRPKSRRLTRRPRGTTPPMWRWPAMGAPLGRVPSTARSRRRKSSARRHTCSTRPLRRARCTWWMPPSLERTYAGRRRPCSVASRGRPRILSTSTH